MKRTFIVQPGDEGFDVVDDDSGDVEGTYDSKSEADDRAEELNEEEESADMERANFEALTTDVVRYDMPILRADSDKREVWGWASSSVKGLDGKRITHECNKEAFQEWINRTTPDGLGRVGGNMREMHAGIAAGRAIAWEPDDVNQRIYLGTRVSRGAESTWQKIEDGTLAAFSVNAKVLKHHVEFGPDGPVDVVERMRIREVSYVDSGGDPTSRFVDIIRSACDSGDPLCSTGVELVDDLSLELLRRGHGAAPSTHHDHGHTHNGADGLEVEHHHPHDHPANHVSGVHDHPGNHTVLSDHTLVRSAHSARAPQGEVTMDETRTLEPQEETPTVDTTEDITRDAVEKGEPSPAPDTTEDIVVRDMAEAPEQHEMLDIATAQLALSVVNKLLVREMEETTDPNDANDGSHIQHLLQARSCLVQFCNEEESEGGVTTENLTRSAKAAVASVAEAHMAAADHHSDAADSHAAAAEAHTKAAEAMSKAAEATPPEEGTPAEEAKESPAEEATESKDDKPEPKDDKSEEGGKDKPTVDEDKVHEDEDGLKRFAAGEEVAPEVLLRSAAEAIFRLETRINELEENQTNITRAADTRVEEMVVRFDALEGDIRNTEAPKGRPMTRVVPVEKAFGLEDGEGEITREGAREGFDVLRKNARTPQEADQVTALEAMWEVKNVYADGARPAFGQRPRR